AHDGLEWQPSEIVDAGAGRQVVNAGAREDVVDQRIRADGEPVRVEHDRRELSATWRGWQRGEPRIDPGDHALAIVAFPDCVGDRANLATGFLAVPGPCAGGD